MGNRRVLLTLHAGGSGQLAAFKFMQDPVEVEFIKAHAGLDIGDTAIGMRQACSGSDSPSFERNWACPCNGSCKSSKLIGGARAVSRRFYQKVVENEKKTKQQLEKLPNIRFVSSLLG